jgi:LPS sulfotransferase NodH
MNYFIAFSGRTGSSWLCEMLTSVGRLGRPLEHFCVDDRDRLVPNPTWNSASWTAHYREYLRHTHTENGVTAAKITWHQWARLQVGLGVAPQVDGWVWLRRRNKLRQAISSYKNECNHQPVLMPGELLLPDPPCEEARILLLALMFQDEDVLWGNFLAGRPCLVLWYEEVVESPRACVLRIAAHLGIEIPELPLVSRQQRLANATSDRWFDELWPKWQRLSASECG